uniref:Variant surface glycoprotein 1125.2742 n=1 Tax=Trypanosoma brucei TaxID=5691 RepID=A0A1J0R529_9TRYP|nr:variant surface glycoprotein 1125.2742 [Trypanosoma brucei]
MAADKKLKLQRAAQVLRLRTTAVLTAKALTDTTGNTQTASQATSGASGQLGGGAACRISVVVKRAAHGCNLKQINGQEIAQETSTIDRSSTIKLLPDKFFEIPEITVTAFAKGGSAGTHGTINANSGNVCTDNGSNARGDTHALAAKAAFVRRSAEAYDQVELTAGAGKAVTCAELPKTDDARVPTRAEVAAAICTGLTTTIPTAEDLNPTTGTEVSELPEMATIGRELLITPEEIKAMPKAQVTEKVKERIKSIYGSGATDFKTNYLSALTIKQNYNLGDQSESASIEDIAQKPNAEEILAHFMGLDYRRPQVKNENQGSSDKDSGEEVTEKKSDKGENKKNVDNKAATAN